MTAGPSFTTHPGFSLGGSSGIAINGGPALCVNSGRGVFGLSPEHITAEGLQARHLIQIGEAA